MPTVRPATEQDAFNLAPRLRKADVEEIEALLPSAPLDVLLESIREGTETYSVVADDGSTIIAMFGIHHFPGLNELEAAVWMLAADDLVSIKAAFFRGTIPYLRKFHQRYPLLWNIVDCRNSVHINWLKRFGFVAIKRHEGLGRKQLPFIEFVRIDTSLCVPSPLPA
jgi:hypothetical protein